MEPLGRSQRWTRWTGGELGCVVERLLATAGRPRTALSSDILSLWTSPAGAQPTPSLTKTCWAIPLLRVAHRVWDLTKASSFADRSLPVHTDHVLYFLRMHLCRVRLYRLT